MKMTPQKWRARIQRTLELQKIRRDEAARFLRAYAGDYHIKPRQKLDENKDEIAVNFVYTYVETVRPTIIPGTPKAFVEGLDEQSEKAENHYQAVINHYVRTLGLKEDLKTNVNDWFYSFAAFLTEWEYHEEPEVDEFGEPVFELGDSGEPEEDEEGEPVQAFKVVRDRPIAKRLDPWDVILDPDSKCRKEDRWRGYRMILTKAEFDAMPGVTAEMRKKIRAKVMPKDLVRQPLGEDRNSSNERNWVILWRIYDLENERFLLLPEGDTLDFFVEDLPWPYEFSVGDDRFPITILEAKQDAQNPYSFSGFKAIWSQIQERNKLRTMLQSNTRRGAPGWMGKKGVMDEEQKQKFVNSKIGEYTETNGDPSTIVTKPLPKLPDQFFAHDRTVGDDLINVSGLIEYNASTSIADTATEASILDAKSNIRKGEAKAEFGDFCAVIFSKIGQLAQQFLTVPLAVKIKTPESKDELSWMKVTGEEIQGEFHLTVKPGVDERETEGLFRQQTLKAAEVLANNPWTDQKKLATMIAKALGKEASDILKTEDQYNQEQAAMQEAQKAEAESKKTQEKPPLDFAAIKIELLPPDIQAIVIAAALKQNGAVPGGAGVSQIPGAIGNPGSPAAPSMANPAPASSVMPGMEINQAPPVNDSAAMPPGTPVMPMSEFQGGSTT